MGIGWIPSAYTGAEVKVVIRYGAFELIEVEDVEYSVDRNARPGGSGLGFPRNRYHKTGVPEGTFSISKSYLNSGEQADLFAQLIAGTTAVQEETLTTGISSYSPTYDIVGVLYIVLDDGTVLIEGTDYLVDYVNHGIEFLAALADAGTLAYITDDATLLADDPMDGTMHPFVFDIQWQERDSQTVLKRLRGCMVYSHSVSSGSDEEAFTEDVEGQFLALESRGVGSGILANGDTST